jgi:hypothetical protein
MTNNDSTSLPAPTYSGGTKAITTTPVVGTPRREYAEIFVPGEEEVVDGEMRVTVLGSGNPWVTRAQSSASVLVEIGNSERDIFYHRSRQRFPRELREPEAASQQARQGVLHPPARRPHGRPDYALGQLLEGWAS